MKSFIWVFFLPVFVQLYGASLEVSRPFFFLGNGRVPGPDLVFEVGNVFLQVAYGRVELLVLGRHLGHGRFVLVSVLEDGAQLFLDNAGLATQSDVGLTLEPESLLIP